MVEQEDSRLVGNRFSSYPSVFHVRIRELQGLPIAVSLQPMATYGDLYRNGWGRFIITLFVSSITNSFCARLCKYREKRRAFDNSFVSCRHVRELISIAIGLLHW